MVPSLVLLLLSNSIPIIGVLFFRWDIFSIFTAFWLETVIIGTINIAKMLKVASGSKAFVFTGTVFYIFHFGLFCYGLLLFAIKYLNIVDLSYLSIAASGVAFFGSHLYSYYKNFLEKREFLSTTFEAITLQPYKRIIAMHLSFGLTAVLIGLNRNTLWGMVLMITIKSIFDVWSHLREHKMSPFASR